MKTSLTIEAHGRKITVEFDHVDTTPDEWIDALKTLMIGITFAPETVDQAFREYADNIPEEGNAISSFGL